MLGVIMSLMVGCCVSDGGGLPMPVLLLLYGVVNLGVCLWDICVILYWLRGCVWARELLCVDVCWLLLGWLLIIGWLFMFVVGGC